MVDRFREYGGVALFVVPNYMFVTIVVLPFQLDIPIDIVGGSVQPVDGNSFVSYYTVPILEYNNYVSSSYHHVVVYY